MPQSKVSVRPVQLCDAGGLVQLLDELGYSAPLTTVTQRLEGLARMGETTFVAVRDDEVLGFATTHVTPVLHRPRPVGRLTALVVAGRAQKQGVGRALVGEVERYLEARGCGMIEITSNRSRTGAHAFYEKLGYRITSYRFRKDFPG